MEKLKEVMSETRVIVTFLEPADIALHEHGIDEKQAANLRARLSTFSEEWESPEMNIYDHYDESRSHT